MKKEETFIERSILTGLITSTKYIDEIRSTWDIRFLESETARLMAGWCMAYYDKYETAPGKEHIDDLYMEKLGAGDIPKDLGQDIEEILEDLGQEYKADEFNVQYLVDRTQDHFTDRNLELHWDQVQTLRKQGNIKEAQQLADTFAPLVFEDPENQGFKPSEIYHLKITEPTFYVDKLIPAGLVLLAGKSNAGKSYFSKNIVLAHAQRKLVFDQFKSVDGQILYLSLEDTKARWKRRMREILGGEPNWKKINKRLTVHFEWEKLHQGGYTRLVNWLENAEKPRLIVIDTIGEVWSKKSSTGGGGLYAEEKRIFGELAKLAHKYNITIIILHHTTMKEIHNYHEITSGKVDIFDTILGGQGTIGSCDTKMVLTRKFNQPVLLSVRSRDMEDAHWLFDVSGEGAKWTWQGDAGHVQKNTERQSLQDWLAEYGPAGFTEIKKACQDDEIEASSKSVNTVLRKMVKDGSLEQPDGYRGSYAVAGHGQKASNKKVKLRKKLV